MKEVLTKSFWQGVKKTFYDALEEPASKDTTSKLPTEGKLNPSSTSEALAEPASPSDANP